MTEDIYTQSPLPMPPHHTTQKRTEKKERKQPPHTHTYCSTHRQTHTDTLYIYILWHTQISNQQQKKNGDKNKHTHTHTHTHTNTRQELIYKSQRNNDELRDVSVFLGRQSITGRFSHKATAPSEHNSHLDEDAGDIGPAGLAIAVAVAAAAAMSHAVAVFAVRRAVRQAGVRTHQVLPLHLQGTKPYSIGQGHGQGQG